MFEAHAALSGFSVNDQSKAKAFYTNILGLTLSDESMGLNFKLPGGGSLFIYEKKDHQPATFTVLNLIVNDIDKAVDMLTQQGVRFEHYDSESVGGPRTDEKGIARGRAVNMGPDIAWFKDPSGNIISVLQDQ